MESKPDYAEKVIDTIIQYNDRFIQPIKSIIMARLFKNYIDAHYEWSYLMTLLPIVENMNPILIDELKIIFEDYKGNVNKFNPELEGLFFSCGIGFRYGNNFQITKIGKDLFQFGINELT